MAQITDLTHYSRKLADNGTDGHNGDNGPANAAQLIARCGADEANSGTMRCMVIVVNKTIDVFSVYDAVRRVWKVNIDRANKAEYVFAANRGVIIGAFKLKKWYPASGENRLLMGPHRLAPGRSFFAGSEAPKEIQDRCIGKWFIRSKGEQIPFRYINI